MIFLAAGLVVCTLALWVVARVRSSRRAVATPVFYINLERRRDRKEHVERQLELLRSKEFGVPIRIDACDGNKLRLEDGIPDVGLFYDTEENAKWDPSIRWMRSLRLTGGEVGCIVSHMRLWQRVAAERHESAIIFEDDATLATDFVPRLSKAQRSLPADWDLLYLGYILPTGGLLHRVDDALYKVRFVFGTFGYMISKRAFRKIRANYPISRPVDNFLGHLAETGVLNAYAIHPPISDQIEYGGVGSDILHSAHMLRV